MIKLHVALCCQDCPNFSVMQTMIQLSRNRCDTYLTCSNCGECEILAKFEEEDKDDE